MGSAGRSRLPFSLPYLKPLAANIAFIPLPEPVATRQMFLAAHAGALLDLPGKLADDCRAALRGALAAWKQIAAPDLFSSVTVDPRSRPAAHGTRSTGNRHRQQEVQPFRSA